MPEGLSVMVPNPSRAQRRAALVAQIASEREAAAGAWRQAGQQLAMAHNAWRLVGSFVRRPSVIVALAVAVWVIGPQRGFSLLKGIARATAP